MGNAGQKPAVYIGIKRITSIGVQRCSYGCAGSSPTADTFRKYIKMEQLSGYDKTYVTLTTMSPAQFFSTFPFHGRTELCGYPVKGDSQRYYVFRKSLVCVKCGIRGNVFRLQTFRNKSENPTAHFNLYAVTPTGTRLMTKDHVIPKSKGGQNGFGNYVTMCDKCNREKGNDYVA
jgi:hypothetical protein